MATLLSGTAWTRMEPDTERKIRMFRHQYLVHTSDVFMPPEQTWVHSSWSSSSVIQVNSKNAPAGLSATGVELVVRGSISSARAVERAWVAAEIINLATDSVVATQAVGPLAIPANGTSGFEIRSTPDAAIQLWSVGRPLMHTARVSIHLDTPGSAASDVQNISFGVRQMVSLNANTIW